jgi:hypothetical protein
MPGSLKEARMDKDELQAIAARDQFWASLRVLLPEIEKLAAGQFDGSERERLLVQLLARVTVAELEYRGGRQDAS